MENANDFVRALRRAGADNKGITIVGPKEDVFLSYKEIWNNGLRLSQELALVGAKPGDEIVIQCRTLKYQLFSFWACLLGGFVAVPVENGNNEYYSDTNNLIFRMLDRPFFLYDSPENPNALNPCFGGHVLNIAALNFSDGQSTAAYRESMPEDILYLQFTSGSTGVPKGVIIKTSNIAASAFGTIQHFEIGSDDIILSWQSLTHCYGLVVYHLVGVAVAANLILIPTDLYMQNPLLWFEKAEQYKATRLGTIPFAMRNFVNFLEQSAETRQWDLSRVKTLFVGAEMVKEEVCDRFMAAARKYNLRNNVIMPIYGLSEAIAIATGSLMDQPFTRYKMPRGSFEIGQKAVWSNLFDAEESVTFIGIGKPLTGNVIEICGDSGESLPEHTIGHILIKGTIVTAGYYKNPEETKAAYTNGWLRTGDIGFLHDGELIVVGREKEIIVVNGMKYTCNVIEDMIQQKIGQPLGQTVACSCVDTKSKTEGAVIFVQCSVDLNDRQTLAEFKAYARRVNEIVFHNAGFPVEHVLPIEEIPKSSSGKIRRKLLSSRFAQEEFSGLIERLKQDTPSADTEQTGAISHQQVTQMIVEAIREMFGLYVSDYDTVFQDYGIVSLNVPTFIERLNVLFGIDLDIVDFFNYPNARKLADHVLEMMAVAVLGRG